MTDPAARSIDPVTAAAHPTTEIRRGVKAVVPSSSRVLLVKERHADGREFWTLPGGGIHPGEPIEAALRRELVEELRCTPVVESPVSEFWYAHRSSPGTVSQYTVFSCAVVSSPRPVRSEGVFETAWVDPDHPPAGTLPQVTQLLRSYGEEAAGVRSGSALR